MVIQLTSSAFADGSMIPSEYTCDGRDISPPLAWAGAPEGTAALALICDDPDAPAGTWVHWVLYDLPASTESLPAAVPPDRVLSDGGKQGTNSYRRMGYGGPCPPSGTHRYYLKMYALDSEVGLKPGATKEDLLEAMEGHILGQGQLMGRYKRR